MAIDRQKLITELRKLRMSGLTETSSPRMAELRRALEKADDPLQYAKPTTSKLKTSLADLGTKSPLGGKVRTPPKKSTANPYNLASSYTKLPGVMMKKGGRLKVKKTKGRKRAALRGHRAELRGG
jgi:hypothetical protein|tara:strand:- start:116 stop:490 length:375 start_codon:yes stop_codon:yes gene_type:complete